MNILSLFDLNAAQIENLLLLASAMKKNPADYAQALKGCSLALLFEKPSLRTRVSFEVGIQQLGGQAIYLDAQMVAPGQRESVQDIARNLACWTQGIVARVFQHSTLIELAAAQIPVVNALCDQHHPCQSLADLLTLQERYGAELAHKQLLYVGEGNNVCQSFMVGVAALNLKLTVVTPVGYGPNHAFLAQLKQAYPDHQISCVTDFNQVSYADVVYTDTWLSMGDSRSEAETLAIFMPYQVNQALMTRLQSDTFLHCLPAHRNQEVTDEVLDGPNSAVLQQAENRLYVQKALLYMLYQEKAA